MSAAATVPYRPGNGTDGECFYASWCARCFHEKAYLDAEDADPFADPITGAARGCDIFSRTLFLNKDDPNYPAEWVQDAEGSWPFNPRCTAFQHQDDGEPSTIHDARQRALL